MKIDNVIVGAGIAGITLARRLAEEKNQSVLIIERKRHIGGFCYDCYDEAGILIHKYGPHIFRTGNKKVWDHISRFTSWRQYQHRVLAYVDSQLMPIPINLDTVNILYGTHFDSTNLQPFLDSLKVPIDHPSNVEEVVVSQVGYNIYEKFFKYYTIKQWGCDPKDLPPEVIARIPIRTNRDDRYFTVPYQGLPSHGYTTMFEKMLDHPNIQVMLGADFAGVKDGLQYKRLFYSGCVDEYFGWCFGRLPYRCLDFRFETLDMEQFQQVATVNYPNDYDFTRISEFKHLTGQKSGKTTLCREFPGDEGEPSYPIPGSVSAELYQKYQAKAQEDPRLTFIGRLGRYKYYSMDQIVEEILSMDIG